jgi:hypothetical protein
MKRIVVKSHHIVRLHRNRKTYDGFAYAADSTFGIDDDDIIEMSARKYRELLALAYDAGKRDAVQ